MISPQSIAVGAAAIGLVGKESELFRFTVKHSFIMLFVVCIITLLQAYVITWVAPVFRVIDEAVVVAKPNTSAGFTYLIGLLVAIVIIALTVILINRKKAKTA